MVKIKNVLNYFIGYDIYNSRRKYHQCVGERTLIKKIREGINTGLLFGVRYLPLPFEIEGIRQISNGNYSDCLFGVCLILFGEGIRFVELDERKKHKSICECKMSIKSHMVEMNKTVGGTIQRLEEVVEGIRSLNEDLMKNVTENQEY